MALSPSMLESNDDSGESNQPETKDSRITLATGHEDAGETVEQELCPFLSARGMHGI